MEQQIDLQTKKKIGWKNHIWWIILVMLFWYLLVCSAISTFLFDSPLYILDPLIKQTGDMYDSMKFVVEIYLTTITAFIGVFVYTGITKRNRFIFRSFLPSAPGNRVSLLLWGFLLGFLMNFTCIVCALLNGDIKLFLNFSLDQIPFYLFAFVCVFIQSSSEELWCRGFLYERINVKHPLWLAMAVNGVLFGLLHAFNPGATVLSIVDIVLCGLSFSIAKWYSGSIWLPMGIHTTWNFTQNLLFGLPNSGLVSEASIFGLDAATARSSLIYDASFGVEGGVPAVILDGILGVVCLVLAAKQGRLGELKETCVTPRKDPEGPQPLLVEKEKKKKGDDDASEWKYINEGDTPENEGDTPKEEQADK